MAITRALKTKTPETGFDHDKVEQFINAGGSVASPVPPTKEFSQINIALPAMLSDDIDKVRKAAAEAGNGSGYIKAKQVAKMSWIIEACAEKVAREKKRLNLQ